jgi:hypothetical protein
MLDTSELPSPKDFQLLGLGPDAPQDLVRKAYKAFVKTWHPDRFPQGSRQQRHAEEKLKDINAAYRRIRNHWAADRPENHPENAGGGPKVYKQQAGRTREETAPPTTTFRRRQAYDRILNLLLLIVPRNHDQKKRAFRTLMLVLLVLSIPVVLIKVRPFVSFEDRKIESHDRQIAPPEVVQPAPPAPEATPSAEPSEALKPQQTVLPAGVHEKDLPPAEPEETSPDRPFFTLGSTKKEVLRVQGKPSKVYGQTWVYGLSDVTFKEGRVWRYHNFDGTLQVQIVPSPSATNDYSPQFFSLGSSKDEVVRVQGAPTRVEGNKWSYGFGEIYFRDGVVIGFNNFFNTLKVTLLPSKEPEASPPRGHFTIGSSQDDVLTVQGTPTVVQGNAWSYQLSEVLFVDGKVRNVSNLSGNLEFVPADLKAEK